MAAYFEFRRHLAETYLRPEDSLRVANDAHMDTTAIDFHGSALAIWSSILAAAASQDKQAELAGEVVTEFSNLKPLADQYLDEVKRGIVIFEGMQDLQAIAFSEDDLQAAAVSALLDLSDRLPISLLTLATSSGEIGLAAFDQALDGHDTRDAEQQLRAFRQRVDDQMSALKNQQRTFKSGLDELSQSINSIENASSPKAPSLPDTTGMDEKMREYTLSRYNEARNTYDAALGKFNSDKQSLDGLRDKRDGLQHNLDQLASTIAQANVQAFTDEKLFVAGIDSARDRDALRSLANVLDDASHKFVRGETARQGFYSLLAAASLDDLFQGILKDPGAKVAASQLLRSQAPAFAAPVSSHLVAIARGCMAGPSGLAAAIGSNAKLQEKMAGALDSLPLDVLGGRIAAIAKLLEFTIPTVPPYAHIEDVNELSRIGAAMAGDRDRLTSGIAGIQAELGSESTGLCEQLDAVRANASGLLQDMRATSRNYQDVLKKTRLLWGLILHSQDAASPIEILPKLCMAIPDEVRTRNGQSADQLIGTAANSEFLVRNAEDLFARHALTVYDDSRTKLEQLLRDSKDAKSKLELALKDILEVPGRHAATHLAELSRLTRLSALPVAGAVMSIRIFSTLRQLRPLLMGNNAAYVDLGNRVRSLTYKGVWIAVAVTIAAGLAAVMYAGGTFNFDLAYMTPALALCIVLTFAGGLVGLVFSIRSLITVHQCLRQRDAPLELRPAP
jgi:hypothetical protein